jgi:hypothetical protein
MSERNEFEKLAKRLVNVPKEEIDQERAKEQEKSDLPRKRRPRKTPARNRT